MTYEVQFQIGEISHVVRGPDVEGVLRLVAGLKGQEPITKLATGGNALAVLHSGFGIVPKVCQDDKKAESNTVPWYPDDSGEWIEVPDSCMECPVGNEAEIEILLNYERKEMDFCSEVRRAGDLEWNEHSSDRFRIVAYKIAK